MKIPILKKEIHHRLFKRIFNALLLTLILAASGSVILEVQSFTKRFTDLGMLESNLWATLFRDRVEQAERNSDDRQKHFLDTSLPETSFLKVSMQDTGGTHHISSARLESREAEQLFDQKGISVPHGEKTDHVYAFGDWRIYQMISIPIRNHAHDTIIGYLDGIRRVSLDELQHLGTRILMTAGIAAGAAVLCGILCYFGFVFLNNTIINSVGELNRANLFLLRKLGTTRLTGNALPGHMQRTIIYAVALAEQSKLPRPQIRSLIFGAFLYDITEADETTKTVAVKKESIFRKKPATDAYSHAKTGAALIKPYKWLKGAEAVILNHHERYDGSGYPSGRKHEQIPLPARIFSITDFFDTIAVQQGGDNHSRLEHAIKELEKHSGTHFDPVLTATFIKYAPPIFNKLSGLEVPELEQEMEVTLKRYFRI